MGPKCVLATKDGFKIVLEEVISKSEILKIHKHFVLATPVLLSHQP